MMMFTLLQNVKRKQESMKNNSNKNSYVDDESTDSPN